MNRPQLIIFVKAPLIGRAKTRLAADIGLVAARRTYQAMTARLLRRLSSPKWDVILAVTPASWLGRLPLWDGAAQYQQCSGSLSPRLAQAFAAKGKIVVIGSDSPQVTRADIARAFDLMKPGRMVFGPAADGGFWLMGAVGPLGAEIFGGVRWSSPQTLSDLRGNLPPNKKSAPILLRTLTDVDDLKSLQQARGE